LEVADFTRVDAISMPAASTVLRTERGVPAAALVTSETRPPRAPMHSRAAPSPNLISQLINYQFYKLNDYSVSSARSLPLPCSLVEPGPLLSVPKTGGSTEMVDLDHLRILCPGLTPDRGTPVSRPRRSSYASHFRPESAPKAAPCPWRRERPGLGASPRDIGGSSVYSTPTRL